MKVSIISLNILQTYKILFVYYYLSCNYSKSMAQAKLIAPHDHHPSFFLLKCIYNRTQNTALRQEGSMKGLSRFSQLIVELVWTFPDPESYSWSKQHYRREEVCPQKRADQLVGIIWCRSSSWGDNNSQNSFQDFERV